MCLGTSRNILDVHLQLLSMEFEGSCTMCVHSDGHKTCKLLGNILVYWVHVAQCCSSLPSSSIVASFWTALNVKACHVSVGYPYLKGLPPYPLHSKILISITEKRRFTGPYVQGAH